MGKVTYPYCVKYGGKYYAPNEPVEVKDVEAAVKDGAKAVPAAPETARRQAKK